MGRVGGRDVLAEEGRGGETKRNDKTVFSGDAQEVRGFLSFFSLQSALTSRSASSPLLAQEGECLGQQASDPGQARRFGGERCAVLGTYGNPCCIVWCYPGVALVRAC